jgi:predicted acylesterase/phospholipase RssA
MRALALSGGAAFGAYQAGVWRALVERGWRPDTVVGVSIGAVNAWMLSRGATPNEMAAAWRDWPADLLPGRERRFDLPWRAHAPLFRAWIERVAEEFGPRPTAVDGHIAVLEALTGRPRLVSAAEADGRMLVAACALPGVMAPVRVDGTLYLDFGIVRYLPLREAIESGADDIVAVDLLAAHPFPLVRPFQRAFARAWKTMRGESPTRQDKRHPLVTVVGHPVPLGTVRESFRWDRQVVERLVEDGYRDTAAALDSRQTTKPAAIDISIPSAVSAAPR